MALESNYRMMYASHGLKFPRLSVRHCIDSLRTPKEYTPDIRVVLSWLETEGVATDEEYNAMGQVYIYKRKLECIF